MPDSDFWMGEGEEAHQVDFLNYDFWMARYPVTHAQYMAFVEDGGYGQEQWWPEAITARVWHKGLYTGWGKPRNHPQDWGPQFRLVNLPVVGVSWYEALAFTRWLTVRWQENGWLPVNWQVTLPSEAEWEKGARGGVEILPQPVIHSIQALPSKPESGWQPNPVPQRTYTWPKGELTPERANYDKSEISQTSSAGCYRDAVSVYGCEEMLGNVWEWTRSLSKDYPYDPHDGREILQRRGTEWTILRGGSYWNDETYLRCSARSWHDPDFDYYGYGFRVVLSPFSDSGR